MIEVGVRHHIDSNQPPLPVIYRITDNSQPRVLGLGTVGLRGHVCDLRCEPVYVKETGE